MESVCVMLSIKAERKPDPATGKMVEDYWAPSMKLLGDIKFLDKLKAYDKDNIPPPAIKRLREKYVATLLCCGVLRCKKLNKLTSGHFFIGIVPAQLNSIITYHITYIIIG